MATWHQVSGRDCRDISRLSIGEFSGCSSGMLGKREGKGAYNTGTKGVVTGDETTPTRELEYQTSPFPFSDRDAAVVSSDDLVEAEEIEILPEAILLPRISLTIEVDLIAIQIRQIHESVRSEVECFDKSVDSC